MSKLIIYLRLSREDENAVEESNSITNQRLFINSYLDSHREFDDYERIELKDDGYSGLNMNRPGITKALELLKSGEADVMVVKDFSRFSRDYITQGKFLEQIFPFLGIRFIAIADNYDSKDGRMDLSSIDIAFKGIVNNYNVVSTSMKVRDSLNRRRASGKYLASFAPYGYLKDPDDKHKLIVDEEAAKIVQKIFRLYLKGMSMYSISKQLNADGILSPAVYIEKRDKIKVGAGTIDANIGETKKTGLWSTVSVSRILHNEQYTGTMVYGKNKVKEISKRNNKLEPKESWNKISNHHEAIISQDAFDRVQELLETNSKVIKKNPSHCLVGKVFCENCRQRMVHSNKGKPKYYCNTRYLNEDNTGCVTSVLDETLEGIIINEFNQIKENRLDAKKVLEEQEAEKNLRLRQYEEHLQNLSRSKEEYANRVMGFYEAYRDGSLSQEEYLSNKEAYDLLQIKVNQDIEDASDKVKELRKSVKIGLEVFDLVDNGMQLKKLDRALVERLIERVVVGADEILIEWKFKG